MFLFQYPSLPYWSGVTTKLTAALNNWQHVNKQI